MSKRHSFKALNAVEEQFSSSKLVIEITGDRTLLFVFDGYFTAAGFSIGSVLSDLGYRYDTGVPAYWDEQANRTVVGMKLKENTRACCFYSAQPSSENKEDA